MSPRETLNTANSGSPPKRRLFVIQGRQGLMTREGGWGWVVCAAVFLIHVVLHGLHLSFGVVAFLFWRQFKANIHVIVWSGCVSYGICHLVSPIVCCLSIKYNPRWISALGGALSTVACLLAAFSSHELTLLSSWGIFLGIGSGLSVTSSTIVLCQYFKERRTIINMIAQSGCGFGAALFAPLLHEMERNYSLRVSLLIAAFLVFLTLPISLCFQPLCQNASYQNDGNIKTVANANGSTKPPAKNPSPPGPSGSTKPTRMRDTMPNINPMTIRPFQFWLLVMLLSSLGNYTPCIVLMLLCSHTASTSTDAVLSIVFYGLSFTLGAWGAGALHELQRYKMPLQHAPAAHLAYAALFACSGLATLLPAVQPEYKSYLLYGVFAGFFQGGIQCLILSYTELLVGAKLFAHSWAITNVFRGVGILLGPPIALYIHQLCGIPLERSGLVFTSLCLLSAASCCWLIRLTMNHESRMANCAEQQPPLHLTTTTNPTTNGIQISNENSDHFKLEDTAGFTVEDECDAGTLPAVTNGSPRMARLSPSHNGKLKNINGNDFKEEQQNYDIKQNEYNGNGNGNNLKTEKMMEPNSKYKTKQEKPSLERSHATIVDESNGLEREPLIDEVSLPKENDTSFTFSNSSDKAKPSQKHKFDSRNRYQRKHNANDIFYKDYDIHYASDPNRSSITESRQINEQRSTDSGDASTCTSDAGSFQLSTNKKGSQSNMRQFARSPIKPHSMEEADVGTDSDLSSASKRSCRRKDSEGNNSLTASGNSILGRYVLLPDSQIDQNQNRRKSSSASDNIILDQPSPIMGPQQMRPVRVPAWMVGRRNSPANLCPDDSYYWTTAEAVVQDPLSQSLPNQGHQAVSHLYIKGGKPSSRKMMYHHTKQDPRVNKFFSQSVGENEAYSNHGPYSDFSSPRIMSARSADFHHMAKTLPTHYGYPKDPRLQEALLTPERYNRTAFSRAEWAKHNPGKSLDYGERSRLFSLPPSKLKPKHKANCPHHKMVLRHMGYSFEEEEEEASKGASPNLKPCDCDCLLQSSNSLINSNPRLLSANQLYICTSEEERESDL